MLEERQRVSRSLPTSRRLTHTCIAILLAFVCPFALCRADTAGAAGVYMSCGFPPTVGYGIETEGKIGYRQHPGHCYYSEDGSTNGLINLVEIRWKDWGEPLARARAMRVDNHDQDRNGFQRHPVRIVLSQPRPAVGHEGQNKLYYTRLRIIDSGSTGTISLFRPGQSAIRLPEY